MGIDLNGRARAGRMAKVAMGLLVLGCTSPLEPEVPRLDGVWRGETALGGIRYVVEIRLETTHPTSNSTFEATGSGTLRTDEAVVPFRVTGGYGDILGWVFDFGFVVSEAEVYGYEGVILLKDTLQGNFFREPHDPRAEAFLALTRRG